MPITEISMIKVLKSIRDGGEAALPDLRKQYGWSAFGMAIDLNALYFHYPSHDITIPPDETTDESDFGTDTEVFFNLDHPNIKKDYIAKHKQISIAKKASMITSQNITKDKYFAIKSRLPNDNSLWIPVLDIFENDSEDILIRSEVFHDDKKWKTYKERLETVKNICNYVVWLPPERYHIYENQKIVLADNNEQCPKKAGTVVPFGKKAMSLESILTQLESKKKEIKEKSLEEIIAELEAEDKKRRRK